MPRDLLEKEPQDLLINEKPARSLGRSIYSEAIAPIVEGSSTLAFGIPRLVARSQGVEELLYPEQETVLGKLLRGGAETVGFVGGGIGKAAVKAGSLIPKLAGEKLVRKVIRGTLEGATAGALLPTDEGLIDASGRLKQSAAFGVAGGALPIGLVGLKKTGQIVTSSGRWIANNVGGITDATISTIKKLGVDKVFDPIKAKADYITQDLAPKVYERVSTIVKSANDAYSAAMKSAPAGKKINIRPAIEEAGKRLKNLGLITDKGSLTELGNSEIARDSVYGKLLDFYKSADAISGVGKLQGKDLTQSQIIKASKAMYETSVNSEQYLFLRDKLNALYKGKPSDIDVSKVVNQFYQDGENAGIKGLQEARKLVKKAFEIEDKVDIDKISRDLIKAKNPQWTKRVEEEYKKILGEEGYRDIWDDLMSHFANQDFGLVTQTPGAGGGIYTGRSGLIKAGVGKVTKEYYRRISPLTTRLNDVSKKTLESMTKRIGL